MVQDTGYDSVLLPSLMMEGALGSSTIAADGVPASVHYNVLQVISHSVLLEMSLVCRAP